MVAVRKIDHCAVYVHDVDRSVTFYQRLLGQQPAYRGDTGMGVQGAFFIYGDTVLALLEVPEEELLGRQHVAFAVNDADRCFQQAVANGFETDGPPSDLPVGFVKGQRSFDLRDPDGALLEFVERPAVDPFGLSSLTRSAASGGVGCP
jgi:catechol 2,3-dioxygenase-like lactoylglutathione lyase family enzyme